MKVFSNLKAIKNLVLTIVLLVSYSITHAQICLPKIFSSNMVLQRNIDIPVWGTANEGTQVTVELGENRLKTISGKDGKWMVRIPKMKAGGPYKLTIYENSNSKTAITFENVLIGDVWLASGQSNMEWEVMEAKNADVEIKNANYPNIRYFNVPHNKTIDLQNDVLFGEWVACDSSTVKTISAVAYFYARNLHEDLNIPIGIMQSTWGGTPVETWTSHEQLLASPITRSTTLANDSITPKHFIKDSLDLIRFWDIVYNNKNEANLLVTKNKYNDSEWPELEMPKTFKDWDMPFYEGMVWFRKNIDIPKSMLGKELIINLGHPEMNYSLYFNGQEICKTVWNSNVTHDYKLPAKIVNKGNNTIAVRIAVLWGGGGFNPPAEEMYITDGSIKISLSGTWKYKKDLEPTIPKIHNYHQFPSYLYNAMINPIIPYGIKGFIWYQGENNVDAPEDYQTLFPNLISDWRIRWQQGHLPFLYVQLANYMKKDSVPTESNWAKLREAQTLTLNQPNTGMACIIDIGEENSIHPINKQEVGHRLALLAEKIVYGKSVQAYGPIFNGYKTDGNKITINFSELGSGLSVRDSNILSGFAISGDDKKFYWADAIIEGNSVIVSSKNVSAPVAVRYAWGNNPTCNLMNKEALPALPFRTDDWDVDEEK